METRRSTRLKGQAAAATSSAATSSATNSDDKKKKSAPRGKAQKRKTPEPADAEPIQPKIAAIRTTKKKEKEQEPEPMEQEEEPEEQVEMPRSASSRPVPAKVAVTKPKVQKEDKKAEPEPIEQPERPRSAMDRPRRSLTVKKVSYVQKDDEDDMMEMSSSSSSASDSDEEVDLSYMEEKKNKNEQHQNTAKKRGSESPKPSSSASKSAFPPKKRSKAQFALSSSSSSEDDSGDSEFDSDEEVKPVQKKKKGSGGRFQNSSRRKKTGNEVDKGDMNWPKCSKASIARKTGNPAGSRNVKSGLRMAVKQKPAQPWKKNLTGYEADRKMAKGERRMKEYRIVAHSYARGKIEEVSYDECFKIHEEMKKAYHEGRKIIEAIEKKEREEETGEKESSSEDEWEEMEHFHPTIDEKIEVTLEDQEDQEGVEKDWWVVYLRQEINKKIRESWENTHKVHLLCYMAHLKLVVKTALDESLVPSLMVSQLPGGYLAYVGEVIPMDVMQKLVKWFADAFRPLNGVVSVTAIEQDLAEGHEARWPATSRLTALIGSKCFETDLDRATLLFCLLRGMETTARICVNARTIQRKWDAKQQAQLQEEIDQFREISTSRSGSPKEEKKEDPNEPSTSDDKGKKKSGGKGGKSKKSVEERNYWVEYWQPREKRWICIDPLHKTVDEPLTIHENATMPMSYVFAIDNQQGICEVSQRYAMDCVKQEFRRRRTDPAWIFGTLALPCFAANAERRKWEQMQMREDLVKRPLPTTMSEYKNHPLYVLEKDLLKFEAIYPPPSKQKPLGQIRGHNVYPRSTVFTLQGENNWLKLARSVKVGEEPYKVVKARPDPRIPVEDRVDQFLNVYGYWQTEPYRRPPLDEDGNIPRNEYGNVYMFNENMCPLDCVHLKLSGLVQIARKLDKQCVPAVVGWAFDGGWTHPVMDGAIVLKKDEKAFRKEWERLEAGREEREEKKRQERVYENWKKLIKGMLRLAYVRKQFGNSERIANKKKKQTATSSGDPKKEEEEDNEEDFGEGPSNVVIDNGVKINPLDGFSLDDFINKKK